MRAKVIAALGLVGGPMPSETIVPARETKPPRRASKPGIRASKPPLGDTARPTEALSESAIRAALKQGHHTKPAIRAATGLAPGRVTRLLRVMRRAGTVRMEGSRSHARYHLA